MSTPESITTHAQEALVHLAEAKQTLAVTKVSVADQTDHKITVIENAVNHSLETARVFHSDVFNALMSVTVNAAKPAIRYSLAKALRELATYDALLTAWNEEQAA